jgi:hypothetical protein
MDGWEAGILEGWEAERLRSWEDWRSNGWEPGRLGGRYGNLDKESKKSWGTRCKAFPERLIETIFPK